MLETFIRPSTASVQMQYRSHDSEYAARRHRACPGLVRDAFYGASDLASHHRPQAAEKHSQHNQELIEAHEEGVPGRLEPTTTSIAPLTVILELGAGSIPTRS